MKYWYDEVESSIAAQFDLESKIALGLIERFGSIAAKIDGEDSGGRSKLELQQPAELVTRCFQIAETFIAEAEKRGGIKQLSPLTERAARSGLLRKAMLDAEWSRPKKDTLADQVDSVESKS